MQIFSPILPLLPLDFNTHTHLIPKLFPSRHSVYEGMHTPKKGERKSVTRRNIPVTSNEASLNIKIFKRKKKISL